MPDRALLRVTVRGEGASRDDAYRSAAGDATAVDQTLEARRSAPRSVAHGTLVVQPRTRWKKGESVRTGWLASRTSTINVIEFSGLGELIAELAAAGADISGPEWQVDPSNPTYEAARRDAAIDARRRAHAYADALGLSIGMVRWIAEPGLRDSSEPHSFVAAAALRHRGDDADEDEGVIDVTPKEMSVRAAVEIGFNFAEPT